MINSRETTTNKRKTVRQYYLRDDVSRLTTGKKNTVTVQKVKKQRRLLCDSLLNLHKKFVSEHGEQISYAFFCRQRPFWVVTPNEQDRETCQCKSHENLQFMADTLYRLGLSESKHLDDMVDSTVCNNVAKSCAYGECQECRLTTYPLTKSPSNGVVNLTQWCLEKIDHSKPGEESEKTSTITVKKKVPITEDELATQFQDRLFMFRRHIFNIRWQYNAYRNIKENLTSMDCLIHIDFSENYTCKYANEIQSVHFGGSHQQVTLHTGVLYVQDQPPIPFSTISPSRRHDPVAIWAHLDPILEMVKNQWPDVQHLHFFSDGPATQYKQKGNFYMICSEPHQKGFPKTTWNFFEASHGKGAPDGVGGALKRSADTLVRRGRDIPDALSFFQELNDSGTQVKLFYVSEEDVETRAQKMLEVPLVAIKGTMKMHQVLSITPGILKYRDISCFCQAAEGVWDCPCYSLQEIIVGAVPPRESVPSAPQQQHRPDVIEAHHSGQWCIVRYDDQPYPGIILEVEEHNIKVKCMHRNGANRFFWPNPKEDVNWYGDDQIMCFMPEPVPVNKRSVQVDQKIWTYVEGQLHV
ncbi:uncharacterized protein LOC118225154 [Anguilla anguilla]|uniref:uncharacterized protein LOC118225154 n=1 Tax=Anguilla anguilla TaxID=7936 RepID=UPI0015AAC0AD|nr:uncharacterized protein LOC118225154 [Anguilla anguilla]